jgi:serine/threonine protein phosphatase PrpC
MSTDRPTPTPGPAPGRAPPPALASAALTDPGRQRAENEDACAEFPGARLYIVADGMGGRAAGGVAAQLGIEEIERFFREQQAAPRRPWPFPMNRALSFGTNLLAVGFKVANQRIRAAAAARAEYHRMGATAAALAVGETQVVVAHVGDVRVYRLRAGALTPLTRDHSVIEEVRAARPDMTEVELGAIANRAVVTRALGTREEVEASVTTHALGRGDLYLLCSDGLWSAVEPNHLAQLLGAGLDLRTTARSLVDAANQAGGPDNITALLVQVS